MMPPIAGFDRMAWFRSRSKYTVYSAIEDNSGELESSTTDLRLLAVNPGRGFVQVTGMRFERMRLQQHEPRV